MTVGSNSQSSQSKSTLRSIAFGSPFVVNEAVSIYLEERGLHHRFVNVVNDGDVIPGAMSTLGGLSTQDVSNFASKTSGIDVDGILRTVTPLIGAAVGYSVPAALGTAVGGYLWNYFFNTVVQRPILTYRPIGKYIFLRKKYGIEKNPKLPGHAQYLTTPDVTSSLDSVLHHFQTISREFANRTQISIPELHRHHSTDAYLDGLLGSFSVPRGLHEGYWRSLARDVSRERMRMLQERNARVPGEWYSVGVVQTQQIGSQNQMMVSGGGGGIGMSGIGIGFGEIGPEYAP
ncbi:hypothetical protein HDU76_012125, partial [Blyttiomyces sp. JEL0837]